MRVTGDDDQQGFPTGAAIGRAPSLQNGTFFVRMGARRYDNGPIGEPRPQARELTFVGRQRFTAELEVGQGFDPPSQGAEPVGLLLVPR
jgi:hypothetical protein